MDTEKPITVTDALLALAEQYRSDMMTSVLSERQRRRRIAEINRVIERVEKPQPGEPIIEPGASA